MKNLRFAFRQLVKSPGFTVVALLTLALGIGVNTTTYTLVNAILYRSPPYRNLDRLVQVFGTIPQDRFGWIAPANLRDVVEQATIFQSAAPCAYASSNLAEPGQPANRVPVLTVAANFFGTLGVLPILGRAFTPADDQPGHNNVMVVSEQFWKGQMGGNPSVLGKILRLNGTPVTVIGVMPANCQDYLTWGPIDMWQPLGYNEATWSRREYAWMNLVARLNPGVSLGQAQAQMNAIAVRLAHDHPETNAQAGLNMMSYEAARSSGYNTRTLWLVMVLMLFVLLIACANLANLQLARTTSRIREHAIRIALGASRGQRIRQLLTESIVLSMIGGTLGLLVAVWGNRLLGNYIQIDSGASGSGLHLDYRVLIFSFVASVATGIGFGLMPAWIASGADVNLALKQSGRGSSGGRSKHGTRQILVVLELALALTLLAGAGYFVRGIERLNRLDSGWQAKSRLNGSFVLSYSTYPNKKQVPAVVDRLLARLAELPGIDQVAVAGLNPIYGFSHKGNFLIQGQAAPPKGTEPLALIERVTPDYFSALGIHLMAGRTFTAADRAGSRRVIIINAAMARQFWPRGDAIGQSIAMMDPTKPGWEEIVGIVNDVRFPGNPGPASTPFQTYRAFAQDPENWNTFTLYGKGATGTLVGAVRLAVAKIDPDLAVFDLDTIEGTLKSAGVGRDLVGWILGLAAALGLALSLIGVYGVIANLAIQRTQEIGIRMALGASPKSVLWLVLGNGIRLAALGTGIGFVGAFIVTWSIGRTNPGIPGQDPLVVIGLAALLISATLLACWVPARRATRIDPVEALRAE
jgi:predicted permease